MEACLFSVTFAFVCIAAMQIFSRIEKNLFYNIIISLSVSVVFLGALSLFMAFMNRFDIILISILQGGTAFVVMIILIYRNGFQRTHVRKQSIMELCFIAVLLLAGVYLYLYYSFTYILADRDPFVYLLYAKHISETKGIVYRLDEMELASIGRITPFTGIESDWYDCGFPPYVTSLFAIGYSLLGLRGASLVNPILGLLAVLLFYVYLAKGMKRKVGAIAAVFLFMNPAQIWNARVTQSEIICQIIFFLSMIVFEYAQREASRAQYIMAVVILSFIHLARIDMYLCGLGVSFYMLYLLLFKEKEEAKLFFPAFIVYLSMSVGMFISISFCTPTYIRSQWESGALKMLFCTHLIFGIFTVIFSIARLSVRKKRIFINVWQVIFSNKSICAVLFFTAYFILKYAYYHYTLRPFLPWFVNYVSMPVLILFLFGIIFLLFSGAWEKHLLFLVICGGNLILYLWDPNIAWDNIWISRRWVTLCIPFVIALGAYGMHCIMKSRLIKTGLVLTVIGIYLYASRGYIVTPMLEGMEEKLEALNEAVDEENVYFTTNQKLGWPLRFLYGKHVYQIDKKLVNYDSVGAYLDAEKFFYYIGDIQELEAQCGSLLEYETETKARITAKGLDRIYEEIPSTLYTYDYEANIYKILSLKK